MVKFLGEGKELIDNLIGFGILFVAVFAFITLVFFMGVKPCVGKVATISIEDGFFSEGTVSVIILGLGLWFWFCWESLDKEGNKKLGMK